VETDSIRDSEIGLLLNDFAEVYGYDFSGYSEASFRRRVERVYSLDKALSFAEFRYKIKTNPEYFSHIVDELTVNVTEMLRDPSFYKTIKEKILPVLATYPLIRIWHAGCSTGEEVYSMAILLKEAGLLHKSLLYATDINTTVIDKARKGIFPLSQMQKYSENYILSGGTKDFSSYYTANYNLAKFDDSLGKRMIFATHNLVSDFSFNHFQFILCRNVLIYFNKDLQAKVLSLFDASLENLGFLALGTKESLRFSNLATKYIQVENKEKIWRKNK
jgi:chemotaxis protein methyltransferase CheR